MENPIIETTAESRLNAVNDFESNESPFAEVDSTEPAQNISVQAWAQAESTLNSKEKAVSNSEIGDNNFLTLTPIDWGKSEGSEPIQLAQAVEVDGNQPVLSDGDQEKEPEEKKPKTAQEIEDERVRNSILEAFERIKEKETKQEKPATEEKQESQSKEPEKTIEKPVEPEKPAEKTAEQVERENIKKSLRDLYLNPKEDPLDQAKSVREELAKHDRQTLEEIAQEEIDELKNSVPKKEYEETEGPSLLDRAKYPVLTALVAYGGYRIIKDSGKAVLKRVRGNTASEGEATESKSGEKSESKGNESRQESKVETKEAANEETESRQRRGRRTRSGGQRQVVELNERVESKTSGDGLFQQEKVAGSEAILGREKSAESLTRTEVDMLKQEIARLKTSKDPAEVKRGNNLERVAKILENSNSPKVQERAHKIIRERMEAESARRGLRGKVGKAVGIGIIASAALYYYISQLDHSQDDQENDRASVSDK